MITTFFYRFGGVCVFYRFDGGDSFPDGSDTKIYLSNIRANDNQWYCLKMYRWVVFKSSQKRTILFFIKSFSFRQSER